MKFLLFLSLVFTGFIAKGQRDILKNPKWEPYKQRLTVYTDSSFTSAKEISTDFLKLTLLQWNGKGWKVEKSGTLTHMANIKDTIYIKDDQFVKTTEYREFIEKFDPSAKARHKLYQSNLVKKYGKDIGLGIWFGVPTIGMTSTQFLMCEEWPNKRNTTETRHGTSEQWVYDYGEFGMKFYYFTNNKLTAIQD
ncbi:hypothetical protein [Sphingobacterium siyangense]|uniref:hypothetical protein n=1 Tax=Sphingobacterium siyangense TaxID=459529 RepID=UPI00301853ED